MNTLLNILPWALAILAGVLYYFSRKKAKGLEVYKLHAESIDIHYSALQKKMEEETLKLTPLQEKVKNLDWLVNNLRQAEVNNKSKVDALEDDNLRLQSQLDSAQETIKSFEDNQALLSPLNSVTPPPPSSSDIIKILNGYDKLASNSAIVTTTRIQLKATELIREDYIKVIKGLHEIKLFPNNLYELVGFDPQEMTVHFDLIQDDEEGDPVYFKPWDQFLHERDQFIQTINEYVESVINQKKINEAVNLALSGKEVASV